MLGTKWRWIYPGSRFPPQITIFFAIFGSDHEHANDALGYMFTFETKRSLILILGIRGSLSVIDADLFIQDDVSKCWQGSSEPVE
jgi:hypothetical protein